METPYIVFDRYDVNDWVGKTYKYLNKEMDDLRKRVKMSTAYTWDNSHFYIAIQKGILGLQVSFFEHSIDFWNAKTGTCIHYKPKNEHFVTEDLVELVNKWLNHIEKNDVQCTICGQWLPYQVNPNYDSCMRKYSYAGMCCDKCFHEVLHSKLPEIDTSG
jgi:phage/plasmid-associated DNA primase